MVKRNAKRMNDANNWIVFIRGNHDTPAYFDGKSFKYKRFIAIPDYSVINAGNHSILCVGGAISVDRTYRLEAWSKEHQERQRYGNTEDVDDFSPSYYWKDESPTYNDEALTLILSEQKVDIVITHTSPSFCELLSKEGLDKWTGTDKTLLSDIQQEREVMNRLYETLTKNQLHVTHWCYGHFHQSWHSSINGTLFKMLDIMEFYELI